MYNYSGDSLSQRTCPAREGEQGHDCRRLTANPADGNTIKHNEPASNRNELAGNFKEMRVEFGCFWTSTPVALCSKAHKLLEMTRSSSPLSPERMKGGSVE